MIMKGQISIARAAPAAPNCSEIRTMGPESPCAIRGRHLRGQVSTELLIVVGIMLLIFIPILVLVYINTNETNAKISSYQAELAVVRLAYLANSVGSLGSSTSIIAEAYIPQGVLSMETKRVHGGGEIIMRVTTPEGESEIAEITKYPIANPHNFTSSSGWARFNITSNYSSGEAQLIIDRVG